MKADEMYDESMKPTLILFGDSDVAENEKWVNKIRRPLRWAECSLLQTEINQTWKCMLLPFNILTCKLHQFQLLSCTEYYALMSKMLFICDL